MRTRFILKAFLFAAAVAMAFCPAVRAEDPIATALDASEAGDFLGAWKLEIEVMSRKLELYLTVADVNGKTGATLDSQQQPEPLAISEIAKTPEGGLDMNSELTFGGSFKLTINIALALENGALTGRIKDKGGIFDAPLVGTRLTEEEQRDLSRRQRAAATEARANYNGKRVQIQFADLKKGTADWKLFEELQDGQVYEFTLSRATKMYTDLDLKFGEVLVKKENVAPDYPGVYSVWLKKVGDGWNLVFNNQPDIWGTRHEAEFDAAEVPLRVAKVEGNPADKLKMEIAQTPTGGTIRILWNDTKWETDFSIVQ